MTGFTIAEARRNILLAEAAYAPWIDCESVCRNLGFTRFEPFEAESTEAFVCSNSDHIQMVMFEDRYLARNPAASAPGPPPETAWPLGAGCPDIRR